MKLKCLALWQPWATLVVLGLKKFETRSQYSQHRGLTGILATKSSPPWAKELFYQEPFYSVLKKHGFNTFQDLPVGGVIGTVEVQAWRKIIHWNMKPVHPMAETHVTKDETEKAFGLWDPGRYAIELDKPFVLHKMFGALGKQNLLFDVDIPKMDLSLGTYAFTHQNDSFTE